MRRSEGDLLKERFWSKTERAGDCILWTGAKDQRGYGSLTIARKSRRAHRVAYELAGYQIPEGLVLDHLCNTPSCVNPNHLRPCTDRENILRGSAPTAENARKNQCPRGHDYDIVVNGGRSRWCSTCNNEKSKEWVKRNRQRRAEITRAYRERKKRELKSVG